LLYRGGEQPDFDVEVDVHVEVVEQLERLLPHRRFVEEGGAAPENLATEEEVLDRFQIRAVVELLEDQCDASLLRLVDGAERNPFPLPEDLAGVGAVDPCENLHQGRLARAVLAQEANDLAGADREAHAVEGTHARERPRHLPHLEEWGSHITPSSWHGPGPPRAR